MPGKPLGIDPNTVNRMSIEGKSRGEIAEHFGVAITQLTAWCLLPRMEPRRSVAGTAGPPTNAADIADRAAELRDRLDPRERVEQGPPTRVTSLRTDRANVAGGRTRDLPRDETAASFYRPDPRDQAPAPAPARRLVAVPDPVPAAAPVSADLPAPSDHVPALAPTLSPAPAPTPAQDLDSRPVAGRSVVVYVRTRAGSVEPVDLLCPQAADVDVAMTFAWAFGFEAKLAARR